MVATLQTNYECFGVVRILPLIYVARQEKHKPSTFQIKKAETGL